MSEVYTLTLQDIQSSPNLRNKGAIVGDEIINGKLSRVYSKEEDAITSSYILTNEDIASSPNLQSKGAKAGERIVDGKYRSSQVDDTWTQFKYGWDEEQGFLADAAVWLESHLPIGEIHVDLGVNDFSAVSYSSPDELYGEGFSQATPEQRREMIIDTKHRQLQEKYGQDFVPNEESTARTVGNVAAMLTDPTTAIPLGGGVKAAGITGAALGGTAVAAKDWAMTGEVDPVNVGIGATLGAVIPMGMVKGGKVLGDKSANKLIKKAQAKIDTHISQGGGIRDVEKVLMEAKINPAAVKAAQTRTGTKVRIPANQTSALRKIDEMIQTDQATSRLYSKSLDKYLGSLSTRIGNIHQGLKYRLREFEFNTHVNTAAYSRKVEPFFVGMKQLPKTSHKTISRHLANGELDEAAGVMKTFSPELADNFNIAVRPVLKDLGKQLKEVGHTFDEVENYFPRLVKDYDSLRKSLGMKEQGYIDKQIEEFAKKKNKSVSNLTNEEKSRVTNLAMRGYRQTTDGGKPRFVKQRTMTQLDDKLLENYASPEESLSMYIRNAVNDIEKRKFMGRAGKKDNYVINESGDFDADKSIGKIITDLKDEGQIRVEDELPLQEMLSARFIGGEQTPSKGMSTVRDLGYMGTIANPISAITQFGDLGVASGLKGFRNTLGAMFKTKDLKIVDLGIDDLIAKELALGDQRATAKALNKLMGVAGFKRVDRLGKETFINASLRKAKGMVKTPKGEQALRREVKDMLGDETDSFIADLKAGRLSDNVKLWSFNQLSDVQPISLSEMPQAYLSAPNGRILYMLKSFTLKQLDILRREVIQEWAKGNKYQASKNAALLAGYVSAANVSTQSVKDILLGREVRPEDLPSKSLWALLGAYGLNEYTYSKYLQQGKLVEGAVGYITPATPIIDAVVTLGMELTAEEEADFKPVLRGVPLVGPLLYSWFGGGAEAYNERQESKD